MPLAAAAAGIALLAWLGREGQAWSDFEFEALHPLHALLDGRFATFAALAPAYGGSLLALSPFAALPKLLGAGQLVLFESLAIPCQIVGAAVGLVLFKRMRSAGAQPLSRWLVLLMFVCNPAIVPLLEYGHPEELLCACLCISAVLLAAGGRAIPAGALLGIAVGCKYWPLVALGPALLVLPARRRAFLLACATAAAALLAPIALLGSGIATAASSAASTSLTIFHPWQVFWFFGHAIASSNAGPGAVAAGYREAPGWLPHLSHPLAVAVPLAAAAALALRRRRQSGTASLRLDEALRLLALAALLRCLLDTFDNVYYTVPMLLALTAAEAHAGRDFAARRAPVLALCATILVWIGFERLAAIAPDDQAAFFLAWTLPLAAILFVGLYAPGALARRARGRAGPLRPTSAPSTAS